MPSHPKGLYVLYATELWERFSFYGMKALLVLYLNSGALSPERLPNMLGSSAVIGVFGQPTTPQQVQALSSMLNELYRRRVPDAFGRRRARRRVPWCA